LRASRDELPAELARERQCLEPRRLERNVLSSLADGRAQSVESEAWRLPPATVIDSTAMGARLARDERRLQIGQRTISTPHQTG